MGCHDDQVEEETFGSQNQRFAGEVWEAKGKDSPLEIKSEEKQRREIEAEGIDAHQRPLQGRQGQEEESQEETKISEEKSRGSRRLQTQESEERKERGSGGRGYGGVDFFSVFERTRF